VVRLLYHYTMRALYAHTHIYTHTHTHIYIQTRTRSPLPLLIFPWKRVGIHNTLGAPEEDDGEDEVGDPRPNRAAITAAARIYFLYAPSAVVSSISLFLSPSVRPFSVQRLFPRRVPRRLGDETVCRTPRAFHSIRVINLVRSVSTQSASVYPVDDRQSYVRFRSYTTGAFSVPETTAFNKQQRSGTGACWRVAQSSRLDRQQLSQPVHSVRFYRERYSGKTGEPVRRAWKY